MVIDLPSTRQFSIAFMGAPRLGGPCARPGALESLFDLLYDDGVADLCLTGDAVDPAAAMSLEEEVAHLAEYWPVRAGVRTHYPCAAVASGMRARGRDDWCRLEPVNHIRAAGGVLLPLRFVHDRGGRLYGAACAAPVVNGPVDSLELYAGGQSKDGDVERNGSTWLLRSGAFSSPPGTTLPVTASFLLARVEAGGRLCGGFTLETYRF